MGAPQNETVNAFSTTAGKLTDMRVTCEMARQWGKPVHRNQRGRAPAESDLRDGTTVEEASSPEPER